MSRRLLLLSIVLVVIPAMAKTVVVVGTCRTGLASYPTVSQAISNVPAWSTILVCPGRYPEQIVIYQPLILQGVQDGNSAGPIVIVPTGGLTRSVALGNDGMMFFQILVQNTDSEQVRIADLAVEGGGIGNTLGRVDWLCGICYRDSSGTLERVTTSGQSGNGYGFGVFIESLTASVKTITINRSSVRDFDADGIRSNSHGTNLSASVTDNAISLGTPPTAYSSGTGISIDGTGTIFGNRLLSRSMVSALAQCRI
jgi:hypothetical protein